MRYRHYCSKRMKRIRKNMKFSYGIKGKFVKKDNEIERKNDPKMM